MPEYLAPGVYVEETSYRTKSIEGVGTTTTAFVGPTRYGPLNDTPEILTSLADFELTYGDGAQLDFDGTLIDNYMWQAARAFFTEGGNKLYVKRIYANDEPDNQEEDQGGRASLDGIGGAIDVSARYPGAFGNFHVRFTLVVGPNVLANTSEGLQVNGLSEFDVVLLSLPGSPATTEIGIARSRLDTVTGAHVWFFDVEASPSTLELAELAAVQLVTVTVSVGQSDPNAILTPWAGLPLDPRHQLGGAPDSMSAIFGPTSSTTSSMPIEIDVGDDATGFTVLGALFAASSALVAGSSPPVPDLESAVQDPGSSDLERSLDILLEHGTLGSDGILPPASFYEGAELADGTKTGLVSLEDLDDISIVAAPGSSHNYLTDTDRVHAIISAVLTHAQYMRYRVAVIDAGNDMTIGQVRDMRGLFDSSWGALYYPWIEILDPVTNQPNEMPPSGFVAGIYARNDINRAVYKAPANEVVNLAIGFEKMLNKAQQEVLNPVGVNCFRFFEGRGFRLWGARTMSSDSEWKYLNIRRYFAYLEHSIDKGTQWAVFEPNGPLLWANVRGTIDEFLFNEWQNNALLGDKPEKAYFVKCDRSTMTQNDLDNGRLVCLIGVAPLRPAEFVIFRIGQWTADAKH